MRLKKLISLIMSAAMLIMICPFATAAENLGRYKVISDTATVFTKPDLTSEKLGEVYKGLMLEVEDISRHFGLVSIASSGITGWVQLVNLEYIGTHENNNDIVGLKVYPPKKLCYTQDIDNLDLTGMKVYAVYADGIMIAVTGYEVFCDSMNSVGEKEIRVTYTQPGSSKTFTDSFTVTVGRFPVSRITVISKPEKTEYIEHQPLDLTGLIVKLTYTDGSPERLFTLDDIKNDSNFTIDGCCNEADGQPLEAGTHTLTVTYRYTDISTSFTVNAVNRTLTSLSISKQPNSLVTHHRDRLPDIAGLVLLAEYDNGETEYVDGFDCEIICDPSKFILGENNPVDISYGGKTVRLFYRLSLLETVGIRVITPRLLSFISGEPIDLTGLKVQLIYSDGSLENITDYEMSEIDPEITGSQNITVTYGEYSDVFTISITPYYRKGDVNGDGKVAPEDARLALRTSVGYIKLTGLAFKAADVDADDDITPSDARLILRASVGLEKF